MQQEQSKESIPATSAFNPHVVARRHTHEKVVSWINKSSNTILGYFGLIGLVFLCLPVFIKPWRQVVENTPVLSQFFLFSTSRQGGEILLFIALVFSIFKLFAYRMYPNAGSVFLGKTTPPDIAYPKTIKEEIGFWLEAFLQIAGTSVCIYFPFGMVSFFLIRSST